MTVVSIFHDNADSQHKILLWAIVQPQYSIKKLEDCQAWPGAQNGMAICTQALSEV